MRRPAAGCAPAVLAGLARPMPRGGRSGPGDVSPAHRLRGAAREMAPDAADNRLGRPAPLGTAPEEDPGTHAAAIDGLRDDPPEFPP